MGDFVWSTQNNPGKGKGKWGKIDDIEDYLLHEEEVSEDLLRLDVYFKSMTSTYVNEEPKYNVIRIPELNLSFSKSTFSYFRLMSYFVILVGAYLCS